jgi:hypothetical protein
MSKPVVPADTIAAFNRDGAVALKGYFAGWEEVLRAGIARNMAEPSADVKIYKGKEAAILDASASPAPHHDTGILRMQQAGVTITNTKGIYYEWVRNLASLGRVEALRHNLPPDMTL